MVTMTTNIICDINLEPESEKVKEVNPFYWLKLSVKQQQQQRQH